MWANSTIARKKAADVDAEELIYMDSHDGEGRVASIAGEILFEDEEDINEGGGVKGQARKKIRWSSTARTTRRAKRK